MFTMYTVSVYNSIGISIFSRVAILTIGVGFLFYHLRRAILAKGCMIA